MTGEQPSHGQKKLRAASFSLFVNVFLTALKLAVVFVTGSVAILAELFHSVFDMLASILAYIGIKKANEPADESHHYGHEKFENLSSLAQTILITITAVFVIYESLQRLWHPAKIEASELGIVVMGVALVIDILLSRYLHKASEDYGSAALEADAYHFTTDIWSIIAVIIGLVFVIMGYPFFDSLAAIVVAIMMLFISYHLGKKAIHVLMDKSPPGETLAMITEIISSTKGVESFHKLRARQAGSKVLVEVHIQVRPKMTVAESHQIAHDIKEMIKRELPQVKEVTIHVEPSKGQ